MFLLSDAGKNQKNYLVFLRPLPFSRMMLDHDAVDEGQEWQSKKLKMSRYDLGTIIGAYEEV